MDVIRDFIFDMETADPDDMMALCLIASHPGTRLRAVTVTPGSTMQVAVVRHILERLELSDVPVGARKPDHPKECVSGFHYKALGKMKPSEPDGLGHEVLADAFQRYPNATIVTGAPLGNLRHLLCEHENAHIAHWVGQGGFAGDNVVPAEHRLDKFAGRETCPTFNFNGDPRGASMMLSDPRVQLRHLVSKNVCHGVVYDQALHDKVTEVKDQTLGLGLLHHAMSVYLKKRPSGKKFHDPLAVCAAIDSSICDFREVELYREKGQWGSRPKTGSNTFITVAVNEDRFHEVLTAH